MLILSQRPDISLIEEVALVKGINPSFVEKDWWVVQVLNVINEIQYDGFEIIFSGGTCLSKAHLLLQRFSEDIDFRVAASKSVQNRKSFSAFKKEVVAALRSQGLAIDDAKIKARDGNRFFSIVTDYQSYFSQSDALRPHILIEITIRATQLPPVDLPVSSFVAELTNQLPEVRKIRCINPVESAADKLSAIVWRIPDRVRGGENDDPSLVRHLHDLTILKDQALEFPEFVMLVLDAIEQDKTRAKNVNIGGVMRTEKFQLMLKILEDDLQYSQEYDRFVKGVSYADNAPDFDTAIQAVRDLVKVVG